MKCNPTALRKLEAEATPGAKICSVCGVTFSRPKGYAWKRWARREACSTACSYEGRRRKWIDRFHANVRKSDGCWLWGGTVSGSGYGRLSVAGRDTSAHRLSYEVHVGEIPDGAFVLHRCDVRLCVNPAHLFLGTAADNSADMVRKGRSPWGESSYHAKLSECDVLEIRHLASLGTMSNQEIAERWGVTRQAVVAIVRRRTWAHLAQFGGPDAE